jgi:hypothetical protein
MDGVIKINQYYNEWLRDYESNPVNLQDFENKIIENVLSEEDYAEIYEIIDAGNEKNTLFKDYAGHLAYTSRFSPRLELKLTQLAREATGMSNIFLSEYSIARYSPKYGYVPKLFPHIDSRKSQSIVMDIQLKSNFDWPLVVDNREYLTKDNTALLFSGTQQIHWRKKQWIYPDDQVDMIFCHFLFNPAIEIPIEQIDQMSRRANNLMEYTQLWIPPIVYDANNPNSFLQYKPTTEEIDKDYNDPK